MNNKFLLSEGKKHGCKETVAEAMDAAKRFYDDFYGRGESAVSFSSQKNPNIKKLKKPVFSRKFIRESLCKAIPGNT